jgi:peptide/nickel transport system substrate-binding protein
MKKISILIVLIFILGCNVQKNSLNRSSSNAKDNKQKVVKLNPSFGGTVQLDGVPVDSLNFIGSTDSFTNTIIHLLADSLVSQDDKLNYVPRLAEKWDIRDNKTIIFFLRKNVRFHDGVPFTADDVVFTYNASLTADFPWGTYEDDFANVKTVKKIDDFTVKVVYKNPTYNLVQTFSDFFILPKHIYDTKKYTLSTNPANLRPIGTGAYKLFRWDKGAQIVLVANKDYFNGRPYIDKLVFKVLDSGAMKFNMLLNNELDLVSLSSVEWKFKTNSPEFLSRFYKLRYYTLGVFYLGWNCKNKFFKNKLVRKAMAYCVDLHNYNKKVQFGLYRPAPSPVHINAKYFADDLKICPFKLDKASELLKKAGLFKKNKDGILIDKKGNPFEFNMLISSGSKSFLSFLEYMQQNLLKVGVKMNIKVLEYSLYSAKLRKREFDGYLGGISTGDDPIYLDFIFSKKAMKNGMNYMSYVNDKCEQLFTKLETELNPKEREKYFKEIQHILYDEQPWLPLYYPSSKLAVNKKVKNIKPSPYGIFQWYPGFQKAFVVEEKNNADL